MARTRSAHPTRTGAGRPTLQTIADRLGISRATVSNAYNRPDQLTPELREKILRTAQEVGYAGPNPAARTLRRGTSRTIGVLYTEALTFAFTDPAAVALLRGISEVSAPSNYSMQLIPSPPGDAASVEAVRDAVVDGFIVYCMPHGDPRQTILHERGLPVVMVDESPTAMDAFVGIDDRGGARAVAQHLIDLGHRRFAVIVDRLRDDNYTGPADIARQEAATFDVNTHRLRGYADALEPAGIDWPEVPVIECHPLSPEAGAEAAAYLLDAPAPPTAILCGADQLALGVLEAARARGLAVPDDLSVAGFDDIDEASRSNPPLTTVHQPLLEKGRAAARQLFADWSAGPPEPIVLPLELIVRQSTGPAPS